MSAAFDINKVNLEEIVMVNAAINNPSSIASLQKDENIDIGFELKPGVNLKQKKIKIVFECTLAAKVTTGIVGKFELAYFFHIDNLESLIPSDENEQVMEIDVSLLSSLANIVYSTSRGIIYSRCLGTVLQKVILPVISTNKLLEPFQ